MAATYEPIATATPSGVSEFTFSSIPSTYTDLVLVGSVLSSGTGVLYVRMNGVTSTSYGYMRIFRNGTTDYDQGTYIVTTSASSTRLGTLLLNFNNYSATTLGKKNAFGFYGYSGNNIALGGALDTSSAISSITIGLTSSNNFTSPSRLTLYGITRA